MEPINISQTIQVIGQQYSIANLSFFAIIVLIIVAAAIKIATEFCGEFGKDLYSSFAAKLKKRQKEEPIKESEASEPAKPLLLSFAVPQRNPNFTGRKDILADLRTSLTSDHVAAWKQALTGLGGTGKSQIAAEYSHVHKEDYRFVWWLQSEEPAALASNYAGLAKELDLPEKSSADQTAIIAAVKRWLGNNSNWLLIFDNAKDPKDIEKYLPREGTGHILITSRNPNWKSVAGVLPIEVFKRSESVDFLLKRTDQDRRESADKLADALGDLPLALEQAGAYIEETAVSLADYLKLFQENRQKILERGKPTGYPDTIATTWNISFQAIKNDFPESVDLLRLFAFLAPDNIPRSLLVEGASDLPEPLSSALQDSIKLNDTVAALRRYSLISVIDDTLSVHRLVQAITLDGLDENEKKMWADAAVKIVNKAFPFDSDDVRTWPTCSLLLAHAMSSAKHAEEFEVAQEATGRLLNQAGVYLNGRADFIDAKAIFERALDIGEKAYGPDHPTVAIRVNNLGGVLESLGDFPGAKKLYERALLIFQTRLGENHPSTKTVQNNLNSLKKQE
jgi:tetratricopeptide (TPR) repeat protein